MPIRMTLADARLSVIERVVEGPAGPAHVLVVEPTVRLMVDRLRLERLRRGDLHSNLDDAVVRAATMSTPRPDVVVFRARAGDGEAWTFAPDLEPPELEELGVAIMRSHLSLYRRLVAAGVYAFIGTDLGESELDLLRRGTNTVALEIERTLPGAGASESGVRRLDLWLLDHLALWLRTPLETFLAEGLHDVLRLVKRRRRELDSLRAQLPPTEDPPNDP